jgi:hypothetical protein
MIVAVALWLSKGGKRAVGVPFLEMLIYLFDDGDFVKTPDDGIGAQTVRDGVPVVMISALHNLRPLRDSGKNKNYPDGSCRQTPDGRALMKDRIRLIRDKIRKHTLRRNQNPKGLAFWPRPPVLTKDKVWLGKCFVGLDFLLAGQKEWAMVAFGHAEWPLTGPAMERLNQFLNLTVVNITV